MSLVRLELVKVAGCSLALTTASSFFRSPSPELRFITCCRSTQASPYAPIAPSKFSALSSSTACFALANAFDSIAFCDALLESLCREFLADDAELSPSVPALLLLFSSQFRECRFRDCLRSLRSPCGLFDAWEEAGPGCTDLEKRGL